MVAMARSMKCSSLVASLAAIERESQSGGLADFVRTTRSYNCGRQSSAKCDSVHQSTDGGRPVATCLTESSLTIRQLRGQSNVAGCGGAECAFSIIATMKIELTARVARRRMEFARAMRLGLSSERVDVASGCPTRSASRRPSLATRPT